MQNVKKIILASFLLLLFSIMVTSFQLCQLKKSVELGREIINQNNSYQFFEEDYRTQIVYWSRIYGADLNKALAIVQAESNFRNVCNAQSCKFGQGVFMFIQSTWDSTGLKMKQVTGDTMNPYLNIQRGVYLLKTEGDVHWNMSKHNWIHLYER